MDTELEYTRGFKLQRTAVAKGWWDLRHEWRGGSGASLAEWTWSRKQRRALFENPVRAQLWREHDAQASHTLHAESELARRACRALERDWRTFSASC